MSDSRSVARRQGPVRGTRRWARQVAAELRKVVYPTRRQLVVYTIVVLIFVAVMIAIVSALDLAFGWLMFQVFG